MNPPSKNSSSFLNIGIYGGYGSLSRPAERKMQEININSQMHVSTKFITEAIFK